MNTQPTKAKKRIELLDVYRGFAILGIFVVNITVMNSTYLNQDQFLQGFTDDIDILSQKILQLFFYTKFFPIFSLLFGLGISMQALKLYQNDQLSFAFFGRRMFFLFLIGAAHILFLWSGDVVHLYAIIGLFTSLLIMKSDRLILSLAVVFLVFPFYDQLLEALFNLTGFAPYSYLGDHTGETVNQVIKNGSYLQGMQLRVQEYLANTPMLFGFLAPVAVSMFLLGLYLGKNRIYESLDTFIDTIKKPAISIAVITNLYRIIFLFILPDFDIYRDETLRPVFIKLMVLSDIAMGLFYLWVIGWLWHYTKAQKILRVLQYPGRMALTNYIMQSVVGLILFSSVGFSMYETLSPSAALATAVTVFLFQIGFSKLWLRFFKYGPLEWIWRCFTYKRMLPIAKDRHAAEIVSS
ncbi:DUF418 domain-containing protein [Robertkochia aurantiaca]|uniref:DUF418 domain-containing protein n=1 Tax=Robertkochia aurantiaca TaxID=2873700 RepID=UPI001CCB7BFB|nr:DUF418 domain-containing protein [Robertkochia sp. 3YJGBD-33]